MDIDRNLKRDRNKIIKELKEITLDRNDYKYRLRKCRIRYKALNEKIKDQANELVTLGCKLLEQEKKIKKLEFEQGEVIAEGIVGLDKTENCFYLDDLDYKYIIQLIEARMNEAVGKHIEIIIKVVEDDE